jgi:hypothetical protein
MGTENGHLRKSTSRINRLTLATLTFSGLRDFSAVSLHFECEWWTLAARGNFESLLHGHKLSNSLPTFLIAYVRTVNPHSLASFLGIPVQRFRQPSTAGGLLFTPCSALRRAGWTPPSEGSTMKLRFCEKPIGPCPRYGSTTNHKASHPVRPTISCFQRGQRLFGSCTPSLASRRCWLPRCCVEDDAFILLGSSDLSS